MFGKLPNNALNNAEHTSPKEGVIIYLEISDNETTVSELR